MSFRRLISGLLTLLTLSACLPGMTPTGSPSNPAGGKAPVEEPAAPSGPKDELPSETPSGPPSAVPRSLDVPGPAPFVEGANPGPAPGGGGSGYQDGSNQIARSGGGFCPKPDEVTLEDLALAKDWRAFHGFGTYWNELSKTEPASYAVGKEVPFDLYLDVQGYYENMFCGGWREPDIEGVTVRLIFKSAARNLAVSGHADAPVKEKTADGYNTVFQGITASDGLIDVYVYVGRLNLDGTFTTPPSDDTAFLAETARTHYLGSFATRVTVTETIRDIVNIRAP